MTGSGVDSGEDKMAVVTGLCLGGLVLFSIIAVGIGILWKKRCLSRTPNNENPEETVTYPLHESTTTESSV